MRHPWRLAWALLLIAQAPVPTTTLSFTELRETPPAVLARRLIGREGRSVSHRRLCTMVEGTGCNGFGPGTIILSTDFKPTGYPHFCAADQWTTNGRDEGVDRLALRPPIRSRAFRIGSPCRGAPSRYTSHGEFTVFKEGGATPEEAWQVLRAARQARAAMANRMLPVECRGDRFAPTDLCSKPYDALAEAKLATMYRVVVQNADILRLELWGGDASTDTATYVWVDLHLDRGFESPRPLAIRRAVIEEHRFVD